MTVTDPSDIGRLLAWAHRSRETPGRNADYERLVARYRDDVDFAAAADAVFAGAGLDLVVDDRDGAVVIAASDSPLRATVTNIMKRVQPHHRSVIGAIILAVAHTAYPDPVTVDDPDRIAVFTTQSVVDNLDRLASSHAEDAADDDPSADDDLVEVWRRWNDIAPARANAARHSVNERPGIVRKVCGLLVDAGYLTVRSQLDGGTWMTRPRFRHAVAALTEDSELYMQLNHLNVEDTEELT